MDDVMYHDDICKVKGNDAQLDNNVPKCGHCIDRRTASFFKVNDAWWDNNEGILSRIDKWPNMNIDS